MLIAASPGVIPDVPESGWARQCWLTDVEYSSNGSAEDKGIFKCSWEKDLVDLLFL